MNKKEWVSGLRSFVLSNRQLIPVPARENLTDEEEWQCRIIGGEFIDWYQNHLQGIIEQRNALIIKEFDPRPCFVFTTTMPGLVALREIISEPLEDLIYLLKSEFQEWENKYPDDNYKFHIQHWSFFRKIDSELRSQAKIAFPDVNVKEFRIHSVGDLWGELCGSGGEHLWRWNGEELQLLQEGFNQVIY